MEWAKSLGLLGIMTWSVETDDFRNLCGGGQFTLISAMNKAMTGSVPPTIEALTTPEKYTGGPATDDGNGGTGCPIGTYTSDPSDCSK